MKKAIITLSVILLATASAFAGGDKDAARYYTPKLNQGWFIDLAGTYSIFASHGSAYHHMNTYYGGFNTQNPKHLLGLSLKVGRRVSPGTALRVGYDWHPSYNDVSYFNFKSLHFDAMISPLDMFFGYKPERLYTMWIYGGIGMLACDRFPEGQTNSGNYRYLIHWDSSLELGVHGGIMNNFRLSDALDLHIDLTAVATRWTFDSDVPETNGSLWHRAHFDFSGMVGLMWYLGGRTFDQEQPVEVVATDCSEQERRIQELTEELNNCKANQNTGNVVAQPCDTIVKFVEGESLSYPFSIFFNKGSYELRDGRDRVNLEEFANAAKANGYKIILRGTCDSATASSAFNKTLAENRCNKVKQELVKLGVPESNITINPVGGVKELNPTDYDRRVLIQVSK